MLSGLLVVVMFNLLRWFEHWLHQHIFKVGWLFTKNFRTTTILYYTFLLPGIFLHELTYWLTAGALNVRADQAISWPEKQEYGELHLNFVKLSSRASPLKVAIISITPLFAGLAFISYIAYHIFDMRLVLILMQDGGIHNISNGIRHLTSAQDFWLWAYIVFTVGNTMLPKSPVLRNWRRAIIGITALVIAPLFLIGVGDEIVGSAITGPIAAGLNALSMIFAVIIITNLAAVVVLHTVEITTERITGHSATFKGGKMIVLRREEAIAQRQQMRQKERAAEQQRRQKTTAPGAPSVYRLQLPIPGPPGKEPVTPIPSAIVAPEEKPALPGKSRPRRKEPAIVPSEATEKKAPDTPIIAKSDGIDGKEKPAASSPPAAEIVPTGVNPVRPVFGHPPGGSLPFTRKSPPDTGDSQATPLDADDAVESRLAPFRQNRPSATTTPAEDEADANELTYEDVEESP